MITHRVMQRCKGSESYWLQVFEGTRRECKEWVEAMARAGRHTCSMEITGKSAEDWERLNP